MCVFMISKQGRAEHHRIVVACRWITSEPLPTCAEPMADSRRAHGRRDNLRATNFFSRVDDLDNQVYRKERTGRGTSFRQARRGHVSGRTKANSARITAHVLRWLAGRRNRLEHRADSLVNAPFGAMKTWFSTPHKHFYPNGRW